MAMTGEQLGEAAAIGAAVLWTVSTLAWTSAGRYVGALAVCFVRLVLACVLLATYGQWARGSWWPSDASAATWLVLGSSGFAGFFVADLLVFKALLLIGPRLSLVLQSLTPPLAALISWAWLGERLTGWQWLAMGVTLAGVVWVVLERPDRPTDLPSPHPTAQGILLAALGAAAAAVALVLSKIGLGAYDAVAATLIRVLGGLAGMAPLITAARRWPSVLAAVRHGRAMVIMAFGSVVGPFLGVVLYLVALRHCPAGVVATILATMPVLVLPAVIVVYHEKVSLRAVGGAVLSVVGVALLVL